MPKKIIITVSNDIACDQRVRRMSRVLSDNDYKLTIVGRRLGSDLPFVESTYKTRRFRMFFKKGAFFYLFLNIRIFFYLLWHKADAIIAVDLDTLLASVLIRKIRGTRLIYDAHEYFTGVPELKERHRVRNIWKKIEKYSLPGMEYMITVNNSIAEIYSKEFNVRPLVIRNISNSDKEDIALRADLDILENELVLIMQGAINMDRGLIETIKAIESLNSESRVNKYPLVKLLIIGSGYEKQKLADYVRSRELDKYITFLERMEWESMMKYTRMADVGLSVDSSNCINYRFSLPNKIFEYIDSGIAIIATGLPEIANIVGRHNCGLLLENNRPETIAEAIEKLNKDRALLLKFKNNSGIASAEYSWEKEGEKLQRFIRQAFMQ